MKTSLIIKSQRCSLERFLVAVNAVLKHYFEEVPEWIQQLATYGNVIVKFGRYVPNQKHIFDEVLGVELASDNQYAERFDS